MRLIHALVRKLGWSKEEYREFVLMFNKSGSLKDLSITQGSTIIRELTDLTSDTPQMATPGQVKYIVEHWECVDYSLMEHGDTHLHSFLRHKFGGGYCGDPQHGKAVDGTGPAACHRVRAATDRRTSIAAIRCAGWPDRNSDRTQRQSGRHTPKTGWKWTT